MLYCDYESNKVEAFITNFFVLSFHVLLVITCIDYALLPMTQLFPVLPANNYAFQFLHAILQIH